ncbi:hypothetical protein [Microvirga sp. TS319]|uniref:hypothetical protein n=1 Tax=Microvirga sp. TS319 TaxID=3241165 RepID=UPI00351A83C5
MKKIALGAALLLLSGTAYAQTTTSTSSSTSTSDTRMTMPNRQQSGATEQATGSVRNGESTSVRSNVSTREHGGTRVGVGIESRERTGVSVRSRTVREVEEPSVSVRRHRRVTTIEEPDTEIRHTVIKKKPSTKKVVLKKRNTKKVAVKKRHYRVVDEPVEVRRRTVRRYEEVSEPRVSVNRHTTVRTRHEAPSVGVSVEQRRSSTRTSTDVNTSRSPSVTGSVSTRSTSTGNASSERNNDATSPRRMPAQQPGGSSTAQ